MSPTLLALGAAKVLIKNRKLQLALIGLQFAYVTYKMVTEKESNKKQKQKHRTQKSHNLREEPAPFK